jgi:hypothetical protein
LSKATGGLVGVVSDSLIEKSHATGLVAGYDSVGGLIGTLFDGSIIESYATGLVTAQHEVVGGFIGELGRSFVKQNNPSAIVARSYATGDVKGNSNFSGGFVGRVWVYDQQQITITDSFASGAVVGASEVGGLLGRINAKTSGFTLQNSYSSGKVAALDGKVGGLIGVNSNSAPVSIISSYWDVQTSGQTSPSCGSNTGAMQCGVGKETNEMYQQETFVDWNFNQTWKIYQNNNYPCLKELSCSTFKK